MFNEVAFLHHYSSIQSSLLHLPPIVLLLLVCCSCIKSTQEEVVDGNGQFVDMHGLTRGKYMEWNHSTDSIIYLEDTRACGKQEQHFVHDWPRFIELIFVVWKDHKLSLQRFFVIFWVETYHGIFRISDVFNRCHSFRIPVTKTPIQARWFPIKWFSRKRVFLEAWFYYASTGNQDPWSQLESGFLF